MYHQLSKEVSKIGLDLNDLLRFYTFKEVNTAIQGLNGVVNSYDPNLQVNPELFSEVVHDVHLYKLRAEEIPGLLGYSKDVNSIIKQGVSSISAGTSLSDLTTRLIGDIGLSDQGISRSPIFSNFMSDVRAGIGRGNIHFILPGSENQYMK